MKPEFEDQIGDLMRQKQLMLALAESCTGGLIGHRVTNIPGSSEYFIGGVVAYAYDAKEEFLGVRHETLLEHGAVSKATVVEMAQGVRQALAARYPLEHTVSLAVSGIAGPGGGMPGKPVGLVWIALSSPEGTWAFRNQFKGSRIEIKDQTADRALGILWDYLNGATLQVD